ncbi:MAG: C40 family peptidase, partial [Mycobacteriaceae bacterium]|nr:C40 family peptidase [Mycobacteriaceae bacterium]
SASGQASVLAGGALSRQLQAFPGAQARVGEQNQAQFGRYRLTDSGKGFFGPDAQVASSGQDLKITAPSMTPGLQAELQASNLPYIQNSDGSITVTVPLNAPFVEKYDKGGPTPTGRGPGPTGGYLAEVHPDEYVISGRGRARVPDSFLHALNAGVVDPATLPKFDKGGPVDDPWGAPDPQPGPGFMAPSMPLEPAPIAPNPTGSGISSILGAVSSGLQNPIGNAISLGGNLINRGIGGSLGSAIPGLGGSAGGGQSIPGLWGLFQAAGNPQALSAWGSQTANWLANWGTQTAMSGAQILGQGALSGLGLENSILSPSNVYNQAIQRSAGFYLGQQGPLAAAMGAGGGEASGVAGLGIQAIPLGDGSTIQIPTFGTSEGVSASDLQSVLGGGGTLSPAALRAIQYAQAHAVGQPYVYGGVGPTGYDCSGIGSAIYAAALGLPEGTRYFTTESNFAALGFQPGYMPGDLNIGLMLGGGGPNSHMTLTLPNGVNVESGGASDSTQYGGSAAGAQSLPVRWHLPLPGNRAQGSVPGLYDQGGWLPPGLSLTANHTGKPEGILTNQQTQAVQAIATAATRYPSYADGGPILPAALMNQQAAATAVNPLPPPPAPVPDVTAGHLNSPPQPAQPQQPSLPPQNIPPAPAPPTPTAPIPPENPQLYIPPDVAPAPSSLDHNLPALSTAIKSGASTIGNLAAMAINAAAAAATMGAGAGTAGIGAAGGGLAGAGAGSLGSFVSGLIQEGGKIVNDAANIGSSFLVGSLPGSTGTQDLAYGRTLRAQQNTPNTAPMRVQNNQFNGMDVNRVFQELDIRDAQAHQAALAGAGRR